MSENHGQNAYFKNGCPKLSSQYTSLVNEILPSPTFI